MLYVTPVYLHFFYMLFTTLTCINNFVNVSHFPFLSFYCSNVLFMVLFMSHHPIPKGALRSCNCPLDFKSLATSINDAFQQHWTYLCAVVKLNSTVIILSYQYALGWKSEPIPHFYASKQTTAGFSLDRMVKAVISIITHNDL